MRNVVAYRDANDKLKIKIVPEGKDVDMFIEELEEDILEWFEFDFQPEDLLNILQDLEYGYLADCGTEGTYIFYLNDKYIIDEDGNIALKNNSTSCSV